MKKGFTLIEVMVATGLLSIIGLTLLQASKQSNRLIKTVAFKQEVSQLSYIIQTSLRSDQACTDTLVTTVDSSGWLTTSKTPKIKLTNEGVELNGIVGKQGKVIIMSGCEGPDYSNCAYANGKIVVTKILIRKYNIKKDKTEVYDGSYDKLTNIAYLELLIKKGIRKGEVVNLAKNSFQNTALRKIPINVSLDSNNKIINCFVDKDGYLDTSCSQIGGILDENTGKCKSIKIETDSSLSEAIVAKGDIVLETDGEKNSNLIVKKGDIQIRNGNLAIKKGNISSDDGNLNLVKGDLTIDSGNIQVVEGNLSLIKGDAELNQGNIVINDGNISLKKGNMIMIDVFSNVANELSIRGPSDTGQSIIFSKNKAKISGDNKTIEINKGSSLINSETSLKINGNTTIENGNLTIKNNNGISGELSIDNGLNALVLDNINLAIKQRTKSRWNGIETMNESFVATQGWVTNVIYEKLLKGKDEELILKHMLGNAGDKSLSVLTKLVCETNKLFYWSGSKCRLKTQACGLDEYLRGFDSEGNGICINIFEKINAKIMNAVKSNVDTSISRFNSGQKICDKKGASYDYPETCYWKEDRYHRTGWTGCQNNGSCSLGWNLESCHWRGGDCPSTCGWAWEDHYRCGQNQTRDCTCKILGNSCSGKSCSNWRRR